jgi:hypothetical protein
MQDGFNIIANLLVNVNPDLNVPSNKAQPEMNQSIWISQKDRWLIVRLTAACH